MRKPVTILLSLSLLLPCIHLLSDGSDDSDDPFTYEEDISLTALDTSSLTALDTGTDTDELPPISEPSEPVPKPAPLKAVPDQSPVQTPSLKTTSEHTDTKPIPLKTTVEKTPAVKSSESSKSFQSFTGKVVKNKVRIRQQPRIESPIVRELNSGDMFIVVDEGDEFYTILPLVGTKGYVHRSYILDGIVEGNRVNVRLEPDADAPVITQLSGGEHIDGKISPLNSKWLEIEIPASTRFFISKDYVIKLGDASFMAKVEKRREDVNFLLNSTHLSSQNEMQKPFPEIQLKEVYANYEKIISNYTDFPDQVARARDLQSKLQDDYLQKKIPYLEAKAKMTQQELNSQMKAQQLKLAQLEQQLEREKAKSSKHNDSRSSFGGEIASANTSGVNDKMSIWIPIEQQQFEAWSLQNNNASREDFYKEQRQEAVAIRGIVEPFNRSIKNKPGDYIIMNQTSHLPIAFVYSTQVNLQSKVGQEVTILGAPRSNNNFAFPAYFVLSAE